MYKDENEAKAGVAKFHAELAKLLKSDSDAKDEGHTRSWKKVALGYQVAHSLVENPALRADMLAKASIAVRDGNPFSGVVRMIFRTRGKFNPSAKKYGASMRYAYENGWPPDPDIFVKNISELKGELKDGRKVTKLQAAELLDQEKHGGGEDPLRVEAAFDYLAETNNFGLMPGDVVEAEGREDGSWVSVAAQWDASLGSYVLRAVLGTNSAQVRGQVKKEAVKLFDAYTSDLMRELALQNADVAALNRMDPALRRAHAERIKAEGVFDWDELNARFVEHPADNDAADLGAAEAA